MIYLDSSAVVKLARQEPETDALRAWIAAHPQPLTSSALVRTESARALRRAEPAALPALAAVLALLHQKSITDLVLDAAARLPDDALCSLDAIHLATAEELRPVLSWFVAYDQRLLHAAAASGLPTASPN